MASPTVATSAASSFSSGTTTVTAAAPSGIVAGSVLAAIATQETGVAGWTAAGWELFGDTEGTAGTLGGNSKRVYLWRRLADGVDDSLNINRSAGASSVAVIVRRYAGTFSGTLSQILEAIIRSQFSTPDPLAITPSWGSSDFMVEAAAAGLPGSSTPGYPAGYADAQLTAGEDGVSDKVAIASKAVTGTTENPPAFPGSFAHGFAVTIAVRGTAPVDTTAPNITGPTGSAGDPTSSKSIAEGTTAVHTFTANEAVTWDLNGGADVSFFSINPTTGALTMTARNFEDPVDAGANNTYVVGVRATDAATNAATQTVTITITNLNEAPTFTGTISVPTLTEGVAMTPYATAGFYGDPDAGDTATYSAIGSWPAGVTVNSSTGVISGTPTTPGTYASLQVRRTDAGALTVNSNSFTITVAAAGGVTFTGTVPAKSGTVGTAFDFGSPTMASYFSGAGTYALQAGTLPPGLSVNPTTGAVTGTPTTAGTYAGISVRKTATSGSPATADTNTFTITIAAAPVVPGFDFHTAAGLAFGAISGSLVGLAREVGVSITTLVYSRTSPFGLVVALPATATDSAGRLPRLTDAALVPGTSYRLVFVWPDGLAYTINMAAT